MDCDFITVDRWAGLEAMRLKSCALYCVQVAHEVYERDPMQDLFGSHSILCFMGWICLVLLSLWPSLFILGRSEDGNSLCLSVEMKELSGAWHTVSGISAFGLELLDSATFWTNPYLSESFSLCVDWSNRITSISRVFLKLR